MTAPTNLAAAAVAYASNGWEVFPLHPWDCRCPSTSRRPGCDQFEKDRGKRPYTPHGVLDATDDVATVTAWWQRWPNANLGGRPPEGVVVVDIDPRAGGDVSWSELTTENGDFVTRTAWSGRCDAGRHLYVRHPGGRLVGKIGNGLDLKSRGGYTVLPPSLHAATGDPYWWDDMTAPIVEAPSWLARLMRRKIEPKIPTAVGTSYVGDSIADWYTATRTWSDVLSPHGWHLVTGSGDADGSTWRHPTAEHSSSATVRHGCLFVYSTNTPFDVTDAEGEVHGYTRFRAFATLEHAGNLSDAARAARSMRGAA